MAYSIRAYGEMMTDAARMAAYENALQAACRPGSVVLDLGAGTGMMSLHACRAGAARVYAVEASDAIEVARGIAAANGLADRITFIQGRSTEISLPEPVDVIVADIRGVLPMFGTSLASMIDARRFLAPGGVIIPAHDIVRTALVEDAGLFDSLVTPWRRCSRGFDATVAERMVLQSLNKRRLTADAMLTAAQDIANLDYLTLQATAMSASATLPVLKRGIAHGVAAWFDARTFGEFGFSNAPGRTASLYGQAVFPLPAPVGVEAGDIAAITLRADPVADEYVWSWGTRISSAAGTVKSAARQSTFHGQALSTSRISALGTQARPRIGLDGAIDRTILERLDGETTVGGVAERLRQDYPARFPDMGAALARVRTVIARYLGEAQR